MSTTRHSLRGDVHLKVDDDVSSALRNNWNETSVVVRYEGAFKLKSTRTEEISRPKYSLTQCSIYPFSCEAGISLFSMRIVSALIPCIYQNLSADEEYAVRMLDWNPSSLEPTGASGPVEGEALNKLV